MNSVGAGAGCTAARTQEVMIGPPPTGQATEEIEQGELLVSMSTHPVDCIAIRSRERQDGLGKDAHGGGIT